MEWWYFRDTRAATIEEQRNIAEKYVPDQRYWLGAEPHATYNFCKDITTLIYSDMEVKLKKSPADKPIRKGDTVYVSHMFVLARDILAIKKAIQRFHHSEVTLQIESIGYCDDGERSDFRILNGALSQISAQRKRSKIPKMNSNKKRKPGRPPRNVHYWTLTPEGKDVVRNYAIRPMKFNEARIKLTGKTPDKNSVGEKMFQRLVREYRSILKANQ